VEHQAERGESAHRAPRNTAIERELKTRINRGEDYAFLYIDIDNFKAFNDYFGYQKGDEIITHLANVLTKAVEKLGVKEDFIGHIGGDDFVLITDPSRASSWRSTSSTSSTKARFSS